MSASSRPPRLEDDYPGRVILDSGDALTAARSEFMTRLEKQPRLGNAAMIFDGLVLAELERAWRKFPEYQPSLHHGYAVLLEEMDELWHAIKHESIERVRAEAVQVAAMAIRLLVEAR